MLLDIQSILGCKLFGIMRVGILTFHRAKNYGAILQCYALSTYLSKKGHKIEVIDYFPSYFKAEDSVFPFQKFKYCNIKGKINILVTFILAFPKIFKRNRVFNSFLNKHIVLSKCKYDESSSRVDGYDVIFVGSDQVWNREISGGEDAFFIGHFNHGNSVLASYAASSILNFTKDDEEKYYRNILSNFENISVREKSICSYLNSLNIKKCEQVLDPVLLLSQDQWKSIAIKPKETKYLLLYMVKEDPRAYRIAQKLSALKGLNMIMIAPKVKIYRKGRCYETLSPGAFVGYFAWADYVVSTSFHGTAFAVKMERQFSTVLLGNSVDERSRDLLTTLGISDRLIPVDSEDINNKEVDYTKVRVNLNKLIAQSDTYINSVFDYYSGTK